MGVLVWTDREDAANPDAILFIGMVACSMQSGPRPAGQTFVVWEPEPAAEALSLDTCVGKRLSLARGLFERPGGKVRAPLHMQFVGPLDHYLEHDMAMHIFDAFDGFAVVDKLEFRRLVYRDVTLAQVEISGWDATFASQQVRAPDLAVPVAPPLPGQGGVAGVDFMSLLDIPSARRHSAAGGRRRSADGGPLAAGGSQVAISNFEFETYITLHTV